METQIMLLYLCVCVYSVEHGAEFRITAGLRKCRSKHTHTDSDYCFVCTSHLSFCVQMPVISH